MSCTQENDLMPLLIELGILPCLGILLLMFGLFFIFLKYLSHAKLEQYSNDEVIASLGALLLSNVVLIVASAFLVGAILNNLLISMLSGQPIHWY